MRVLVGGFIAESNVYSQKMTEIQDFNITTGEDMIDKLNIRDIAKDNNIELVRSIYASAGGCGMVSYDSFEYILKQFKKAVRKNLVILRILKVFLVITI